MIGIRSSRENDRAPLRLVSLLVLVVGLSIVSVPFAFADIDSGRSSNVQEGDNSADTDQDGTSGSGDAVAGQIVGVTASGHASLDATNRSSSVDAQSGDAEGTNSATSRTGNSGNRRSACSAAAQKGARTQGCSSAVGKKSAAGSDIDSLIALVLQEGDNTQSIDQSVDVNSGDAIAGQVAGVVAQGLADLVLANISEEVDATSGDAEADNVSNQVTGSTFFSRALRCCPLPQSVAADREVSRISSLQIRWF